MDVTLIAETLDPSKGGIPRYNYELSKIKEIKSGSDNDKQHPDQRRADKHT